MVVVVLTAQGEWMQSHLEWRKLLIPGLSGELRESLQTWWKEFSPGIVEGVRPSIVEGVRPGMVERFFSDMDGE